MWSTHMHKKAYYINNVKKKVKQGKSKWEIPAVYKTTNLCNMPTHGCTYQKNKKLTNIYYQECFKNNITFSHQAIVCFGWQ